MTQPLPADIEFIVQWALAQTGRLPWVRTSDAVLSFDGGLTAKPRRRAPGNWVLAEACAGLRLDRGRDLPALMTPPDDAARVIAAIKRLPPRQASLILACGRAGIRPDWTVEGSVEAVQVSKWVKCKKRKKRVLRTVWVPDPQAIRAARDSYGLWHAGLARLCDSLAGTLSRFRANGLAAPAQPWEAALKKIA